MARKSQKYQKNQRWFSESEPELGLGLVSAYDARFVTLFFPASDETRRYGIVNAPLKRLQLREGEVARGRNGLSFKVVSVEDAEGLFNYRGVQGEQIGELDLADQHSYVNPQEKLLAGQFGRSKDFQLRYHTFLVREKLLGAQIRGMVGARVSLLNHQLSIAWEIATRPGAKVLLADEVGLGKTIEAGLIFHRLVVTGQVRRVLIVVPESLAYQWVVELYRRFNHMITVMDEESAMAEAKGDRRINPFLSRQMLICPVSFFEENPNRVQQATEAGIDLLIVDEAHHLEWSETAASKAYLAVENLSQASERVLLLTATPAQLGEVGHFARLRLLDKYRYTSSKTYFQEAEGYRDLAALAEEILNSEKMSLDLADRVKARYPKDMSLHQLLDQIQFPNQTATFQELAKTLLNALVDRHGTGRVMYRNRREVLGGFPNRIIHPVALKPSSFDFQLAKECNKFVLKESETSKSPPQTIWQTLLAGSPALRAEDFGADTEKIRQLLQQSWEKDPRIDWLVNLLRSLGEEKVLLICSRKNVVFSLQEILPRRYTGKFASFHENMAMTTRDRNAAYFSESDGAQLLICSEIGSEGRNFQFARHLVLFDLPIDPNVLEQRIGRLDRIGQKGDIHIHIPHLLGSPSEVLYRWYQEGMAGFSNPVVGAEALLQNHLAELLQIMSQSLLEMSDDGPAQQEFEQAQFSSALESRITSLLTDTKTDALAVRAKVEAGRDRLLELNSCNTELAEKLKSEILKQDASQEIEEYLEMVTDRFGLTMDSINGKRAFSIIPGPELSLDDFPGIPAEGLSFSFDRDFCLHREDLAFMSIDHPVISVAMDLALEIEEARCAYVEWLGSPAQGYALELIYILEAQAPAKLQINRFLPPQAIRIFLSWNGEDLSAQLPLFDRAVLRRGPAENWNEIRSELEDHLPQLLDTGVSVAAKKVKKVLSQARSTAEMSLGAEIQRLKALSEINAGISAAESQHIIENLASIDAAILQAELRLDSLRLVLRSRKT